MKEGRKVGSEKKERKKEGRICMDCACGDELVSYSLLQLLKGKQVNDVREKRLKKTVEENKGREGKEREKGIHLG